MGRILGIDFGEKRLGLAISDENKRMALPITKLLAGKNFAATIELLKKELSRYQSIEKIVMGLPLHLNGKESPMCERVRAFAKAITEILEVPVDFFDERFTSSCAHSSLKEVKANRKKRAAEVDSISAVITLQNYLDRALSFS